MDAGTARTQWFDRLHASVRSGEPIDLAPGVGDGDVLLESPSDYADARRVPAEAIRDLFLLPDLVVEPRGLHLRGAFVEGTLNLDHTSIPCRLVFLHCDFENSPTFDQALMHDLDLVGSRFPGLSLDSARLIGNPDLSGVFSTGAIIAAGVHVDGQFSLRGATLHDTDGEALNLEGAKISSDVVLDELVASGEVYAVGAEIGGRLSLSAAILTASGRSALQLDRATIAGDVTLDDLEVTGGISAYGSHIGGLDLSRAKLRNAGSDALFIDRADIRGDAFLNGVSVEGALRAMGAHIDGALEISDATVTHAGTALELEGADIAGNLLLLRSEISGQVSARGVHVRGEFDVSEAKLNNGDTTSLGLNRAEISGDANFVGVESVGGLHAYGASFLGDVNMAESTLTGPDYAALNIGRSQVAGSLLLRAATVSGGIHAEGARIARHFDFAGATLSNPDGDALNLEGATVNALLLDNVAIAHGGLFLSYATIRTLSLGNEMPLAGLPRLTDAQGWAIGTVHGFLSTDRKSARDWLDSIDQPSFDGSRPVFASQPWHELAEIYDQIGQPEDARWLRYNAARRTTRVAPWPSKIARWPYAAFVGYGYYPLFVVAWLAALWLTVFVLCSTNASAFTPSQPSAAMASVNEDGRERVRVTGATPGPADYPPFDPALFAVDTAIPAVPTGQSSAWRVTGNTWLPGVLAAVKALAWVLTALLLAGVTGLLRKD
jgi:hypothetical protein